MSIVRTPALLTSSAGLIAIATGCSATRPSPPAPNSATPRAVSAPPAPAACVIDGMVKGPDGAPLAGALVAVHAPSAPSETAIVYTKQGGTFCVEGLPPGDYALAITSPGVTSGYVDLFRTTDDKAHGLEVRLGGEGFAWRGHVVGETGNPAGKTKLRFERFNDLIGDIFVVQSGEDGAFSVQLPPGPYHAYAETERIAGKLTGIKLDRDIVADIVVKPRNPRDLPPPEEVSVWVKQNAIPLASFEPGQGYDDMEPLRAVVGQARLVAFGDATHGTREFGQMRQRMLEFLVERMGFRAVVVEGSFVEELASDEYVRTGKGENLSGNEMLRWMRRYNEDSAHKEKVRYFGNDLSQPARYVSVLAETLATMDKKLGAEVTKDLEPLADDWSTNQEAQFGEPLAPGKEATEAAVRKIAARFDEKRDADVKKLGAERWAFGRIHAHVLVDYIELMKKKNFDERDRSMAETTLRLMEFLGPNGKTILFAHNNHVQKTATPQGMQGKLLGERLGKDYVVFGSAFDQGSFNAADKGGLAVFTVGPAPPGSFDGMLARAKIPLFALDLRSATGVASAWIRTSTVARSIGGLYDLARPDAFFDGSPPAHRIDAVIFVANSTPAHAVATRERSASVMSALSALANGDFEDGEAGKPPPSWRVFQKSQGLVYRATLASDTPAGGKLALVIDREPSSSPVGLGKLAQKIDAKPFRGHRVRVAAKVRLLAKALGDKAFVFAWLDNKYAFQFWPVSRRAIASKDWRETAVELDVPENVESLTVGVMVTGGATVGVDDFTIAPVER
ncbi:MAG TPA: erythromycin esterase family protein [Polyangiaceae bacterium]|nr:erythromycin esterase family protein [Polyangiaceae bacterium]